MFPKRNSAAYPLAHRRSWIQCRSSNKEIGVRLCIAIHGKNGNLLGGIQARLVAILNPAIVKKSVKGIKPYTVFTPKKTQRMVYAKRKTSLRVNRSSWHVYVLQAHDEQFPIESLPSLGQRLKQLPKGWNSERGLSPKTWCSTWAPAKPSSPSATSSTNTTRGFRNPWKHANRQAHIGYSRYSNKLPSYGSVRR